ncbi:MAG: DUF3291 domain-containing protein [Acidimicrobiia bacterium]|nr:DUF3291 domain-containing protein [Acidimicrobiia bacterium]
MAFWHADTSDAMTRVCASNAGREVGPEDMGAYPRHVMDGIHIAQMNIAVMVAATDDPVVAEFMDNLDRINALADEADGFVWRLQTETGNATGIQLFPNPRQLVNMSVWVTVDALKRFVYRTDHVEFYRRRAEWFEADGRRVALWSIKEGTIPEPAEAVRRIEFLETYGPSPYAFGFASRQPPLIFEKIDRRSDAFKAELDVLIARSASSLHVDLDRELTCARYDGELVGAIPHTALPAETSRHNAPMIVDPAVDELHIREALLDQLQLVRGHD